MKVIAKSCKGHEYLYISKSAHSVSARSADYILRVLNECKYDLAENEIWHIHEIDKYDRAYDWAMIQKFTVYKGIVKDHFPRTF